MRIAIWLGRLLVAGIFLYAGVVKVGASERFTITAATITSLPPGWINPLAMALPWLEMAAGILLLIPRTSRLGAGVAAALLLVFITALAWARSQGLAVDCGCFGDDQPAIGDQIPAAIARDAVLLAITLLLSAVRRPAPCTTGSARKIPASDAGP